MMEGYNWREEQEGIKMRWLAWHCALLPYLKNIPSYNDFVPAKKETQEASPQPWQEIKSTMKAFADAMNKGR